MAYMSQENKKSKAPLINAILKKYNIKGSLSVREHSTLVLNVKSGAIDFINNYNKQNTEIPYPRFQPAKDYINVNPYWFKEHFTDSAKQFLTEIFNTMNIGNHNNSDPMTDYFNVGWYVDVNIGNWDKPYTFIEN